MNLLTHLLALSLASASPAAPDIDPRDDGSVVGHLRLDADPQTVLDVLSDPVAVARWSPSVSEASREAAGRCDRLRLAMRGWVVPMRVTAERCPTRDGFELRLIDSNVFRDWGATWQVRAVPGGSEVTYRLWSDLALPVTQGFVQHQTVLSMRRELAVLAEAVERRVAPSAVLASNG